MDYRDCQKDIAAKIIDQKADYILALKDNHPTLASDLTGNVKHFDEFMEAIKRTSIVPISFEKMTEDTDGYFHLEQVNHYRPLGY